MVDDSPDSVSASFSTAATEKPLNDIVPLTIWIIPFEAPAETIHLEETVSLEDQMVEMRDKNVPKLKWTRFRYEV